MERISVWEKECGEMKALEEKRKPTRQESAARREQSKRNDFSAAVRAHIRQRDGEHCVLCGKAGREVHHILPRALGGLGTADNGVCLDSDCHHQAHRSKSVEKQLERFRTRVLLPYYGLCGSSQSVPESWIEELVQLQEQGLICFCPLRKN